MTRGREETQLVPGRGTNLLDQEDSAGHSSQFEYTAA